MIKSSLTYLILIAGMLMCASHPARPNITTAIGPVQQARDHARDTLKIKIYIELAKKTKDQKSSRDYLDSALQISNKPYIRNSADKATQRIRMDLLIVMANMELKEGKTQQVDVWMNRAISIARQTEDTDYLAHVYYVHAYFMRLAKKPEQALEYCDSAIANYTVTENIAGLGKTYYWQGRVYTDMDNYDLATDAYLQSINTYKKAGKKEEIAKTYNVLGNIYNTQGAYDDAINAYENARSYYEEAGDTAKLSSSYINLGSIQYRLQKYDQALSYYQKSLKLKKQIGDQPGVAGCLNNIAMVQTDQNNYHQAIESYQSVLEIYKELNEVHGMSVALNNLGYVYSNMTNYRQSLSYYLQSLEIKQTLNDTKGMAQLYTNIANSHNNLGNTAAAIEYSQKAISLAGEINALPILKDAYEELAKIYARAGNYQQAYEYYKKFHETDKEIFNEDVAREINEIEEKYQAGQREKEIQIIKKESELKDAQLKAQKKENKLKSEKLEAQNKRNIAYYIVTGLGAILFLIILFFYLRIRKEHALQAEQKEEIEAQRDMLLQKNEEIERYNKEMEEQRDFVMKQGDKVAKQNVKIREQRDLLARQKKEITDSINYAQIIQKAVMPPKQVIGRLFPDNFVLFKPRDIVSGDFFWAAERDNKLAVAAVDCTGHGVPGAFMSMLGIAFLNEITLRPEQMQASTILNLLRDQVISSLHQTGKEGTSRDGMDLALLIIDKEDMSLDYAGANNPLYLIRGGKFNEYKADKMPIGIYHHTDKPFTNNHVRLKEGDCLYIFSDGYPDQLGGPRNKKFKTRRFKEVLTKNSPMAMPAQKDKLVSYYEEWTSYKDLEGNPVEQLDDIIVIGIRV